MFTLYGVCAVLGGTVLVCQLLMTLFGLGHAHDMLDDMPADAGHGIGHDGASHHDAQDQQHHSSNWFFGIVTFRTVVAALTFFGLAGLAMGADNFTPGMSLAVALFAGGGAMYAVHALMRNISRLRADGTVRIDRAVGQTGTVYVSIPGHRSGAGRIQMNLQNRTMEFPALTADEPLPPGAAVVVVSIIGPDTVEVARVTASEKVIHA
jgi:membrane protein implicated in regulation of membrane protease activity